MSRRKSVISAFEYYKGDARSIAHGIKEGNPQAVEYAARVLVDLLPKGSTIVPIPNRSGKAETTLTLSDAISRIRPDIKVLDGIVGSKREMSFYDRKLSGEKVGANELGYRVKDGVKLPKDAFLLDNVYDTGTTFDAARKASGIDRLLTFASPNKRVRSVYNADGTKRKHDYTANGLVNG